MQYSSIQYCYSTVSTARHRSRQVDLCPSEEAEEANVKNIKVYFDASSLYNLCRPEMSKRQLMVMVIPLFAGDDARVLRAAAGAGHHHPTCLRVTRHRGDDLPSRTGGHQVSIVQYSKVQYSTVQYSTVKYSTV